MPLPPAFVISLSEESARRARIEKVMKEHGISFNFIDAVDGRQFDVLNHPNYAPQKRLSRYGKHLTGGEIGCLLSHRKVYEKMISEKIPHALIFEDDVILREKFTDIVEKILNSSVSFGMIRFLGSPKLERLKMRRVYDLNETHYLARHTGMPGGAHATLMSLSAAKKLLKHSEKTPYPIDALMGRSWLTGINWCTVRPGLAAQDLSFDSSIGESRFDDTNDLSGFNKILYPLTRAWFKFSESILKKYWYYKTYLKDKAHG